MVYCLFQARKSTGSGKTPAKWEKYYNKRLDLWDELTSQISVSKGQKFKHSRSKKNLSSQINFTKVKKLEKNQINISRGKKSLHRLTSV